MYLLTSYLGCTRLISAWAGMAFIVFPWHLVRTPHGSLTHLEWLPLLLVALLAATRQADVVRFGLVGLLAMASGSRRLLRRDGLRGDIVFAVAAARPCPEPTRRDLSRSARSAPRWARRSSSDSCRSSRASEAGAGLHRVASDLSATACARWSSSCRRHKASSRAAGSRRSGKAASTAPIRPRSATTWGCSRSPWRWAGCYLRSTTPTARPERPRRFGGTHRDVHRRHAARRPKPDRRRRPGGSDAVAFALGDRAGDPRSVAMGGAAMTALVPLAALGLQAVFRALQRHGRPVLATTTVAVVFVASFLELA